MTLWKRTAIVAIALSLPAAAALSQSGDVSARLAALGFLSGDAPDTSVAVRNFQTANGVEQTGALDAQTLDALGREDALSKTAYLEAFAARYDGDALKTGMSGDAVRALQRALSAFGYYAGAADGAFGEATERAVMAFQTANGLHPSGEADASVHVRLNAESGVFWEDFIAEKLCKKGDSGRSVRSLQRRLRLLGYFGGEATASFGERTERAVELFQRENELAQNGQADDETCKLLYGGSAKAFGEDGILSEGDVGEDVRAMQAELNRLGYFPDGLSGEFRQSTLVALTFFEIGNGRTPTGAADASLLEALTGPGAVPFSDAAGALAASSEAVGAETLSAVASVAEGMLGTAFPGGSDELFPGFRFVQYAFARAGIAITDPGQIVAASDGIALDPAALNGGEIAMLERADATGVRMLFAVGLGGGRIAYLNVDTGFVVSGDLGQMEYGSAYVWNFQFE